VTARLLARALTSCGATVTGGRACLGAAPERRRQRAGDRVVVLEATRPPDGTTRYIDQVVANASPRTEYRYLTWRTSLEHFDVLHLHWPEVLVRSKSSGFAPVRCAMLLGFLAVTKLRRAPIVRTLHNTAPHEPGTTVERFALAVVDRLTDYWVTINPVTHAPSERSAYIPHGHYRQRFAPHPKADPVPGRLLFAGLVRPYKGLEQLVDAFESLGSTDLSLRIVGHPTPDLRRFVERAAKMVPRVSARLEFVTDEDFVDEVTAAELVCLPYDELHNSGILMVALSLDRPVLVRRSPMTEALQEEVGGGWVFEFSGDLSHHHLEEALRSAREHDATSRPRLRDRDWEQVAARYERTFRQAMSLTGRRCTALGVCHAAD
jgi:beta-1,4-mannosyltransferase